MDIHVRFWDKDIKQVNTSYFNSSFLGRAAATDIAAAFKEGTDPLPLDKILQISMDKSFISFTRT